MIFLKSRLYKLFALDMHLSTLNKPHEFKLNKRHPCKTCFGSLPERQQKTYNVTLFTLQLLAIQQTLFIVGVLQYTNYRESPQKATWKSIAAKIQGARDNIYMGGPAPSPPGF